jgi:antitoxin VapB
MYNSKMQTAKLFKNGNSQAVRIPAELAYERMDQPLTIERVGDELRIRPAGKSLKGIMKKFAAFPADFMESGRGAHGQREREGL